MGKSHIGNRHRRENNIKTELRELGYKSVEQIQMPQDTVQ
jgi:hypothetical protein